MVGTVSVGLPDDPKANCDRCDVDQCVSAYPTECGTSDQDVTAADCDSADNVDGPACNAASDCQSLIVGEANRFLQYDLSQLCKTGGYRWVAPLNSPQAHSYYDLNICGYTPSQCFPADCADDTTYHNWTGCACTPWNATANIGSVIRFDNDDLDVPPDAGVDCNPHGIQQSCYSDDGVATPCSPSCQVLSATTTDNGLATISFINPESPTDGLVLTYPAVLAPTDPRSPNFDSCTPQSGFDSGVSTVTVHLGCDPTLGVDEAKIRTVSPFGCNYNVQMHTGATCKGTCPTGFGMCDSGFCSSDCTGGGPDAGLVVFLVFFLGFVTYCAIGAGFNKYHSDEWRIPHKGFWMQCLRCQCVRKNQGGDYSNMPSKSPNAASNDFRTPTYGSNL